jgi:TonB family protein
MWASMVFRVLLATALSAFAGSPCVHAQQPTQKLSSPTPAYDDLATLASRLLQSAAAADCHKDDCRLLVANFLLPSEHGSFYGRQLADELAHELHTQEPSIIVIDRTLFYAYLETERIPAEESSDNMMRAIGADLQATTVLVGTTSRLDDDTVELAVRLLSVADKHHTTTATRAKLLTPKTFVDLSPSEPFAPLPPITQTSTGESIFQAGRDGVSLAACTYMPNPPYSDGARKARISGALRVEAIVNKDGKLEDLRILAGLPGGLNKNALDTLKTWRCKPATKDNQPVSVVSMFEVNFRLY